MDSFYQYKKKMSLSPEHKLKDVLMIRDENQCSPVLRKKEVPFLY